MTGIIPLITLDNVSLAFGIDPLLENVKFQIFKGERVCLIGRNGAGKSSLLRVITGTQLPDSGNISRKPHLRLSLLAQELSQAVDGTIYEYVAQGLSETGQLLTDYHNLTLHLSENSSVTDLKQLEHLQHAIDINHGWQFDQNIKTILSRLALNPDQQMVELSGGWQRRAALAKALVAAPELLLLDEPTNHLDIDAIQWLENHLMSLDIGLLFITHDRSLLQRLATRIIELDRGRLTSWPGDYSNFLRRKEEMLHAEVKQQSLFDKKLAQEEIWIRQGIKARRTRNEGRVRALETLRTERAKRREVQGKVKFAISDPEKSGQLVIEAKNIYHKYNDQSIIKNFSIRIMRGDKIGLIGPNGIGKTTLLNIVLGQEQPEQGVVIHGTKLQIAYFDQLRQKLNLEKSVLENVAEGSDTVDINGKKIHVMSYLANFLFSPKRTLTPVKALSGGECNRLLLARLFSRPSNLLVFDEPTNDLDIETLELLEELLLDYQGTLLLVSHDRAFLDHVITSALVFEGSGVITEYLGDYNTIQQQSTKVEKTKFTEHEVAKSKLTQEKVRQKTLNYKEQKELTELPKKIENMEIQQRTLQELIADPQFYEQDQKIIIETIAQLKKVETDLHHAFERWQELEDLSEDK